MKRAVVTIAVLAVLMVAPLHAQVGGVPVVKNAAEATYTSIGAYGQASYFHEAVKQRRCDLLDADAVNAIDQRFENARAELRTRYGDKFSRIDKPPAVLAQNGPCERMTLESYNNHVTVLEKILQESAGMQ